MFGFHQVSYPKCIQLWFQKINKSLLHGPQTTGGRNMHEHQRHKYMEIGLLLCHHMHSSPQTGSNLFELAPSCTSMASKSLRGRTNIKKMVQLRLQKRQTVNDRRLGKLAGATNAQFVQQGSLQKPQVSCQQQILPSGPQYYIHDLRFKAHGFRVHALLEKEMRTSK